MRVVTATIVLAAVLAGACSREPRHRRTDGGVRAPATVETLPPIVEPFSEDFESGRLDPALWHATRSAYQVRDGALLARNARNHPLWLKRPLPCDVRIDFVTWSDSPDGDIKVEIFGDGLSSADDAVPSYTATGYVLVFGGWNNSVSTIVRRDEHRARMVTDTTTRVEAGRRYSFSIRVRGGRIEWYVDGAPFLEAEDPEPLCGPGNDRLGFNDWSVPVHFDDLSIAPLGGGGPAR